MIKRRLNSEEIKYITLFESLTGAKVKDCVQEENAMGFLVDCGQMGLAIGKGGANIEKVRRLMGKSVWVMEFAENPQELIVNLFHPVKIKRVQLNPLGGGVAMIEVDKRDRRRILGENGQRIKIAKKLAQRHSNIEDINVRTSY